MQELPIIEDSRGVDISQIRRQLVQERVGYMVEVTNKLMEIRDTARFVEAFPSR